MTDMPHDAAAESSVAPFESTELSIAITVADVQRSMRWYCDVLGFTLAEKFERDGKLLAASLRAGVARLLVTQDDGKRGERTKGEGFSMMYTTSADVDVFAARIEAAGQALDEQPRDGWRARAFRLRDPDGFRIVIASEQLNTPPT